MTINSDLNILGGLPDWNLIPALLPRSRGSLRSDGASHSHTSIKTSKSIRRFEKAISNTITKFPNASISAIVHDLLDREQISPDSLMLLFWNASSNNELLHYLNCQTFFPAFYSGRISLDRKEVTACLKDLKEREEALKRWSDSTLSITASKYLTLLKKFSLMQGVRTKRINHPYLSDRMFVLFVYWLAAVESKANLLESEWIKYAFSEKSVLMERLMQKKFSRYFLLNYTGDTLKIETLTSYTTITHVL